MKNKLTPIISRNARVALVFIVSAFIFLVSAPIFFSKANALTAAYLYMSRMAVNLDGTGTNTVTYILAIAPTQTIPTAGTVQIAFPDADDGLWCRTAGSLTVTAVASSIVDLASTNWDIDAVLPTSGTLTASCAQGSGASSSDTYTINNVGALTGGTTYGVQLANGTAAGIVGTDDTSGTHTITITAQSGATVDSSTFDLYLVSSDAVTVSATVQAVPTVNCSISSNSVSMGTLYPGGSYAATTNSIQTSTSSTTNGYYWAAFGTGDGSTDAGLYKSSATTDLLASTGSATIDLRGIGAEGFGITLSDPDGAGAAVVATDFADTTTGVFGALDRTYANSQLILYQNGAQTSPDTSTVTYGGRAAASAEAGSYSEVVYFVCGAYY